MNLLKLYRASVKWPGGRKIFSYLVALKAPYFRTITPFLLELSETRCVATMKKRWKVQNHIGTVHAIAICNLCEFAFGVLMEAGLTRSLRWLPRGMNVRYLKKADSDLRVVCDFPALATLAPGDHDVPVAVYNDKNEVVVDGHITVYITERPKRY